MIKVLLFAHLQEEIGQESLLINYEQCTVQQLMEYLKSLYPTTDFEQVIIAVNEEFCSDHDLVKAGDTIALLPPVSGG